MFILNIDSASIIRHTAAIEQISRTALPNLTRQVLNKAAFDVKGVTMPKTSNKFVHRNRTFFKSNSAVEQATGNNTSTMYAVVGFRPKSNDKSHSVEDLQQQEHGGAIDNRSFIALQEARTGGKWERLIRNEAFMARILPYIVDSEDSRGHSPEQKFTKAAIHAGVGGFVIGNKKTSKGNRIVFLIQSINRFGGNSAILSLPLFAVKKHRKVRPRATHFMETASVESAKKMNQYFIELANRRLQRP